jgi:hypothetical protein
VETDCQMLARCLKSPSRDIVAWAGVIEEIRAASILLQQYRVMHVHREANMVAYELAKIDLLKHECVVMCFSMSGNV